MKQVDIINKTGLDKGAISHYASGQYVPKLDKANLIANALGVNVAWLMGYDVPMENPSVKLSSGEEKLLYAYQTLNQSGKKLLLIQCDLLLSSDKYLQTGK